MPTRAIIVLLLVVTAILPAGGSAALAPADAEAATTARAAIGKVLKRCAAKPALRSLRVCRRARAKQRRQRRRAARKLRLEQREARQELRDERPFAPTSFWNAPLADDEPLDAKSAQYVGRLHSLLREHDPYVNTTRYSTPVYTVPADQPTVRVRLDNTHEDLREAFREVPIPPGARPAAGSDGHMVVWQPSTDTMWEFWKARIWLDGWHARYGGKMENVSSNPGHFTEPNPRWGATATSLPLLGGLMRLDELELGHIDHALALALPERRADAWSWPAQRTDGRSLHLNAIPSGARFRIDPRLDLSSLDLSPMVRAMAEAAQRYGLVVRDGAGSIAFYAEDPSPNGINPFVGIGGLFGGRYISHMLREEFPWEHLQVLKTEMTYAGALSGL